MIILTSVASSQPLRGFGGAAPFSHALSKPCSANCTKKVFHVTSGITMALCLQLSSPVNARAVEEMVSVPRGALEELIVRDIATRVHSMDPSALAALMDSLRSTSAPEIRSSLQRPDSAVDSPMAPRMKAQDTQSSEAAEPPQPQPRVPETIAASPSPSDTKVDKVIDFTSSPQPQASGAINFDEDVTSSLLQPQVRGAAVSSPPAEPRTRGEAALNALGSSVNAIAGLPLAIWAFLDTLLPEPLRAGQDLTEEVQRAVLATKGIVLVVSSTLAYFLARGLIQQLTTAIASIPFVRSIADASSTVAQRVLEIRGSGSAALQETPQLSKQAQPETESARLRNTDQSQKGSEPQNVSVPPVPNAQAAMLSAAAPQNAQRRPSSRQQGYAEAARTQTVRPSQPGPTKKSNDSTYVPQSSSSVSPGVLWKRTPGKGALSSKWVAGDESSAQAQPQVRVPNRQYELLSSQKAGTESRVDRKPDDPWL